MQLCAKVRHVVRNKRDINPTLMKCNTGGKNKLNIDKHRNVSSQVIKSALKKTESLRQKRFNLDGVMWGEVRKY